MRIEKTECSYQVTECDLKFGEQITLDGELLIPISVLDKIKAEIINNLKIMDICNVQKINGVVIQSELLNKKVVLVDSVMETIDKYKAQIEETEEYRGLGKAKQVVCDSPTIVEADKEK